MGLRLQDIERLHLAMLAAAAVAAAVSGWLSAISLLGGGAVMGGNFWLLRQITARLFTPEQRNRGVVVTLMLLKFSIFIGLLAALFWRVPLDPLAFGVGATLLPLACVTAALRRQPALAG